MKAVTLIPVGQRSIRRSKRRKVLVLAQTNSKVAASNMATNNNMETKANMATNNSMVTKANTGTNHHTDSNRATNSMAKVINMVASNRVTKATVNKVNNLTDKILTSNKVNNRVSSKVTSKAMANKADILISRANNLTVIRTSMANRVDQAVTAKAATIRVIQIKEIKATIKATTRAVTTKDIIRVDMARVIRDLKVPA